MKKKLLLTGWLLFAIACGYAQTDHIGSFQGPAHPRILWFKGEEAAVQKTIAADAIWGTIHQAILAESDSLLKAPPLERIQIGRRLLATSRAALRRMFYLGYAFRMTQQQKYLQRAEQEMLAISAFSDWNSSHFLDVAEMTMAMAIGYDNVLFISAIEKHPNQPCGWAPAGRWPCAYYQFICRS